MRQGTRHHNEIEGPDLQSPFQVRAGAVVIFRLGSGALLIPAGGGWPGLDRLPEPLTDHLLLYRSGRTPAVRVTCAPLPGGPP